MLNKTYSLNHIVYLVGLHIYIYIYYKMIHGPYNVKSIGLLQRDQQMHTLEQNYHVVLIRKLLNIFDLTGQSSGSAQSYKINFQPFCLSQYVELS